MSRIAHTRPSRRVFSSHLASGALGAGALAAFGGVAQARGASHAPDSEPFTTSAAAGLRPRTFTSHRRTTMTAARTAVLVHGAWADGSSWDRVTPILQRHGLTVVCVQLPMTSLQADINWLQTVLSVHVQDPAVVAGHSYGGAVISGMTGSNVTALAYIAAFAPAQGESLQDLTSKHPATPVFSYLEPPDSAGYFWLRPDGFPAAFAQDADPPTAALLATTQKPLPLGTFVAPAGAPAWQRLPSWYLVAAEDRVIHPDLERFMAQRMGATTSEVKSSHVAMLSHPQQVAEVILAAASGAAAHAAA